MDNDEKMMRVGIFKRVNELERRLSEVTKDGYWYVLGDLHIIGTSTVRVELHAQFVDGEWNVKMVALPQ